MNDTLKKENLIETEFKLYSNNISDNEIPLMFKFDLGIIELLGSQLYTKLPAIISEFVSNAYDADATDVKVSIIGKRSDNEMKYSIVIEDNGIGIAGSNKNQIEEINNKFLKIGRKRRQEDHTSESFIYHRKLQGKKGIGKLAGFGITDVMKITTTSSNITNSFVLDFNKMKIEGDQYSPEHITKNENIGINDGTIIELINIKRKTSIDIFDLSDSIVKRIQIFDNSFKLTICFDVEEEEKKEITLTNEMYLDCIKSKNNVQFSWKIPECLIDINVDDETKTFFTSNNITGEIFTTDTPLKKDDQGIILYANGKLCQENYGFNERANDNFYSYLTGSLNADYIDESVFEDNISTARDSLVWENEISQELRKNIDMLIKKIQSQWREKRKDDKGLKVNKQLNIDIDSWINGLNDYEKASAKKLINIVLGDDSIDVKKATEFIGYIQDMYSFTAFKDFAASLTETDNFDISKALELIKKWEFIEAKEMAKVAEGRIKTIERFEQMINNNESESKIIQPFLEQFPWILDPRIITFKREATFATLLKAEFPDDSLEESNRRLDFICHKSNDEIFILELKRPNIIITKDYIEQIHSYQAFATRTYPNTKITTYLISNNWTCSDTIKSMIDAAKSTKIFGIKSYSEMITDAKHYHSDLIDKYDELEKLKKEELLQ